MVNVPRRSMERLGELRGSRPGRALARQRRLFATGVGAVLLVRAPLTAVIIISETAASRGLIIPLFATALLADGVAALVCPERLYHGLARGFARPAGARSGADP